MASHGGSGSCAVVPSACCGLADLVADVPGWRREAGGGLELGPGWDAQWTTAWRVSGAEVVCPVRDLGSFPVPGCGPVRRFSWRRGQRHRPGLQFMVSTGLHHGFESLEEARVLLALDFAEAVTQVICQPFRLRFTAADGPAEHIPDVLAVTGGGVWLIDVRPAARIGEPDRVKFAASAEAALACGWRYLVVAGWRPHVMAVLDTLSAQRRPLADPLGLQEVLLREVSRRPQSFVQDAAPLPLPCRPASARLGDRHVRKRWFRRYVIAQTAADYAFSVEPQQTAAPSPWRHSGLTLGGRFSRRGSTGHEHRAHRFSGRRTAGI